jgi:hypothetical protein
MGYCQGYLSRHNRLLPEDVVRFLRDEQQQRLRAIFNGRRNGHKREQQTW